MLLTRDRPHGAWMVKGHLIGQAGSETENRATAMILYNNHNEAA